MLLAIDTGNTNTVFAVFKGDKLIENWRLQTENARSADEYAVFLQQVFALGNLELSDITDVIVGSVVPETEFHIKRLCKKYLKIEPVFVTKDNVPIGIDSERPEDVGADRLINAVAVCTYHQSPAIVLDFGTATTFDVINADGNYAGGVIAPGVNLSINALHQAASKLPRISVQKPKSVIGKSTRHAMHSGIFWGYVSMIEGVIKRIKDEVGEDVYVIATGGLAPLFAESIDAIQAVDEELTLKGLYHIYKSHQA
ncbi:MAG: type III pantothenate kinase [Alphaproteobacteria bacterium]|nr:type III pantothenate kinase [Alphaproteobacteria bacterium]